MKASDILREYADVLDLILPEGVVVSPTFSIVGIEKREDARKVADVLAHVQGESVVDKAAKNPEYRWFDVGLSAIHYREEPPDKCAGCEKCACGTATKEGDPT